MLKMNVLGSVTVCLVILLPMLVRGKVTGDIETVDIPAGLEREGRQACTNFGDRCSLSGRCCTGTCRVTQSGQICAGSGGTGQFRKKDTGSGNKCVPLNSKCHEAQDEPCCAGTCRPTQTGRICTESAGILNGEPENRQGNEYCTSLANRCTLSDRCCEGSCRALPGGLRCAHGKPGQY